MRHPEPSDLGTMLSRHNGRIVASLSGGFLLYFALIVAGGSVSLAVASKWWEAAIAFCIAAPLLFIYWRRWHQGVRSTSAVSFGSAAGGARWCAGTRLPTLRPKRSRTNSV